MLGVGVFSGRSVVQEIPYNGLLFVPGLASGTGGWVKLKIRKTQELVHEFPLLVIETYLERLITSLFNYPLQL